MFQKSLGDWKKYCLEFNLSSEDEIDLHCGRHDRSRTYDEVMSDVAEKNRSQSRKSTKRRAPLRNVYPRHSTSRLGKQTARSVVRGFMRSTKASGN